MRCVDRLETKGVASQRTIGIKRRQVEFIRSFHKRLVKKGAKELVSSERWRLLEACVDICLRAICPTSSSFAQPQYDFRLQLRCFVLKSHSATTVPSESLQVLISYS
jgi:hypothetical protein